MSQTEYAVKQVIVLRRDLNMRKGKMIAQGAHASMKVLLDVLEPNDTAPRLRLWPEAEAWVEGQFAKICVGCDSEHELHELAHKAKQAGLAVALIIDAGRTEFGGKPTPTCIAIGPNKSEEIDKITGHLRLL